MTKTEYASGENTYSKAYSYFTETNYTSNNLQAITYKINNNLIQNDTLKYDSLGNIVEILYNNGSKINYTYDDVGRLIREDNTILNKTFVFEYDTWGNHVVYKKTTSGYAINQDAGFIGNVNPIRYKGYYYDVETRLFWLSSRYYFLELCRFISPDSVDYLDQSSINGLNLYAYCNNDPINYAD